MLLFVTLSNRKLVVTDILSFEIDSLTIDASLKLPILILKTSLQTPHNFILLPIQLQLTDSLLNSNTQIGLLDHVIHRPTYIQKYIL